MSVFGYCRKPGTRGRHLASKITADADRNHEIKRCLLLRRKVMTNLDSILKSRDISFPTKVRLVKAMVFPIVMYGCESRTIKKESEVAQLCPTLCDPMNCSTPGLPVHHELPEFTQTHVHRVSDACPFDFGYCRYFHRIPAVDFLQSPAPCEA